MFLSTGTKIVALALAAPAVSLLPAATPARALSLAQSTALHASFDPSLGTLRAGRVDAPRALDASTRAGLASAQHASQPLAALRAGFEMSDNDWKWIALGAGIVLLIVLL
jgi:hypothetical protein